MKISTSDDVKLIANILQKHIRISNIFIHLCYEKNGNVVTNIKLG